MTALVRAMPLRLARSSAALGVLVLLGACASIAEDRGFDAVQAMTKETLGKDVVRVRTKEEAQQAEARIAGLVAEPLTVDAAVQIALLNNRGLQASFNTLGVSAAEMVEAITPPNPGFTYSRTKRGDIREIERAFSLDLLGLLALPFAATVEDRRWEQAKLRTADQVLRIAADTRRAYYRAVAARQVLTYMDQVKLSAEASAELGRRLGRTGTFSKLQQAREQAFYAETMAQLVRARQSNTMERERLVRLLGFWGKDLEFKLPDRLPDLPGQLQEQADLEPRALEQRLDLRMARMEVEGLARSYNLTQATRFINVLEGSYLVGHETGEPTRRGYEISIVLPIFDFGTTKVAHAENTYMAAVNRYAEMAVNARSQIREGYETIRMNHEVARHYLQEVVPARQLITDENLLRYNGMLIGVFELLADAREQIGGVISAIQAQRDFWIADTDFQSAMLSGSQGLQGAGDVVPAASGAAAGGH